MVLVFLQLFEFFLTVVGDRKLSKVVQGNIKELLYYAVAFLQMTEEQVQTWVADANQYVADEDDMAYSCRISGIACLLLLEEIVKAYDDGIEAVLEAAQNRFSESFEAKASGSSRWWKNHLGELGKPLMSMNLEEFSRTITSAEEMSMNLEKFSRTITSAEESLGPNAVDAADPAQFIASSGVSDIQRQPSFVSNEDLGNKTVDDLGEAAIFSLGALAEVVAEPEDDESVKLRIGKCIEPMLTEYMGIGVQEFPFLHARIFSTIAKFSSVVGQATLKHFLFEAMKAIASEVPPPVKVGACRALSQLLQDSNYDTMQPHIIGLFSAIVELLKQASDETMHLVLETLQSAVKAGNGAIVSVEPVISPLVLNLWAQHVSDPLISIDAVEVLEAIKDMPGCLQPLVSRVLPSIGPILQNKAPSDVVKQAYDACFDLVVQITLQSEDHGEIQNATECLSAFVLGGKQDMLSWGHDPGSTIRSLLDSASRLLNPDLDSSASLFVGGYVLQLILHLPSEMQQHLQNLVAALVKRMESSQISGLKNSILLVLARLVHLCAPHVELFINLLRGIPMNGYDSALSYVMSEWTRQQGEIQGSYQIKVTTSALALLLTSRHAELENIFVRGQLIKILSILADMLLELQEQTLDRDEEDSEWEEVQDTGDADRQTLIYSATSLSSVVPSVEHLEAMEKVLFESEDNDYEDCLLKGDPLNEINLTSYIVECITKFSGSYRPDFDRFCQSLTGAQRNILQIAIKR
ncbi:Importin-9 [Nymphaea thermarum]|nr:Importin-9 [Nymphaea thermarum]